MDDKCKCSLRIRLTGDGCRYCQPQEYIDRLEDIIKEQQEEIDGLESVLDDRAAAAMGGDDAQ